MEAVIEMSVLVFNNMLVLALVLAIVLICSTLLKRKVLKKTVIRATKLPQITRQRSKIVLKAGSNLFIFL